MNKKNNVLILSILTVLIIIVTFIGITYSFLLFYANNTIVVSGQSYNFNVSLSINVIKSGDLVPTNDNLISQSINSNNLCLDRRGYALCSMYKITLVNNGSAQTLNGSIVTLSGTNYTTDNLRYQLYTLSNNTYTAVSDASILSHTNGTTNYFTTSGSNMTFSLADGSSTSQRSEYYLVIWLHNMNGNQLADVDKEFFGNIVFRNAGGNVTSSFTA